MREIYLDNSATTRVDPEVAGYIADVMVGQYGNPSSLHRRGLAAQLEWEQGLKRLRCWPLSASWRSRGLRQCM